MTLRRLGSQAALSGLVLAACLTMAATTLAAAGIKLCVPKKEGSAILTPKHGRCGKGYKLATLGQEGQEGKEGKAGPEGTAGGEGKPGPEGKAATTGLTSGELETLKGILPHIAYLATGIGGKPTVRFSGVNVQVVDGEGKSEAINGTGNLVVGYDEHPGKQTGSHNIVLGDKQAFTSYGGLLGGVENLASAPYVAVFGGENEASAFAASVTGGFFNTASNFGASVSGGEGNHASGVDASVQGGQENVAEAFLSSIFGAKELKANKEAEAIP